MNFEKELQRIGKIINDMSMEEFENMLFDCGLGTIRSSEESDFVRSFSIDLFESWNNYAYKNHRFLQVDYQDLNGFDFSSFDFDGQEVA